MENCRVFAVRIDIQLCQMNAQALSTPGVQVLSPDMLITMYADSVPCDPFLARMFYWLGKIVLIEEGVVYAFI